MYIQEILRLINYKYNKNKKEMNDNSYNLNNYC